MALIMATVVLGMATSNCWAVTQSLAGAHASGRWTGIQNFIGNLAGVVVSAATGYVLQRTGHMFGAFVILLGAGIVGALCWTLLIGPIKLVDWGRARPLQVAATHA
jgi:MFS transporter, ACS family, D-galactonate transporter